MSRYTDIDLLLNNYQTICSGVACMDCPFNDEGCRLEKMLLESPTADVVPVKHGHWEKTPLWEGSKGHFYKCSKCLVPSWSKTGYCCMCGTKMDEVTE